MPYSRQDHALLLVLLFSLKIFSFEAFTTSFRWATRSSETSTASGIIDSQTQQRRTSSWTKYPPSTTMKSTTAEESSSDILCALDDDEAWDAYTAAIEEMATSKRVLKKDKFENLVEARKALLSRTLFPLNDAISQLSVTATRNDWKNQAANYKEHYNLTEPQFQFIMRVLVYLGDYCARRQVTAPIHVAWEKLKETGIIPAENAFSTYMYILGTDCNDNACRDSLMEVAKVHDIFYRPNEKTITLQIKTLIFKNEVEEAERILSSLTVRNNQSPERV